MNVCRRMSLFHLFFFVFAFCIIWKLLEHGFDTLWPPCLHFDVVLVSFGRHWALLGQPCRPKGEIEVVPTGPESNLGCNLGSIWESFFQPKWYMFSQNWLPKTSPQSRATFVLFVCRFSDPWTLIFELLPARDVNSQKLFR